MAAPLLTTKLHIPTLRPRLVSRPRLIARLEGARRSGHKLILVSAPAGYGKTTLLGEWVAGGELRTRVAWVSLDEGDNDPARFWTYVVAALRTVRDDVEEIAHAAFQSPHPLPIESALAGPLNQVAQAQEPLVLVLDDYHAIHAPAIHEALSFLLENMPPHMHLAIATRADPPLPIPRLRGRGQLTELYQSDLRFTPEEIVQFLDRVLALKLSAEDVAALERRTEGWIAGLQMAALSMQGRDDIAGFVRAFTGSHRYVLDYLSEEVLRRQPGDVRAFLLQTAILDRLCGELCDAVLESGGPPGVDSQSMLETLERNNLFVVPLDDERRWYRYHGLFADLLRNALAQHSSAQEVRELHRRASRWHEGEGSLEEAMIHAMAAREYERAASMIEENIAGMLARSEVPVLLGWIAKLPEELVRSRPWIDVYRATTLALGGRPDEVEPLLEDVERRIAPGDPGVPGSPRAPELLGHIAAVRAYVANLHGDAARTREMAALTARYLPEGYLAARGMAAYALADARFAADDVDGASQALLDMVRVGEKTGQLMIVVPALCDLAATRKVQGRLHQAEGLYGQAWQWMVERNGLDSRVRCSYEFGLADLLREWNRLDAAHEHAMTGMEVRRRLGGYLVSGDLLLMRVLQARGDVEGALGALRYAEQLVGSYDFQLATMIEFRTARVVQWLAVGDVETASRWAEACDGGSELEQIALARLRLAQGRAADAQHLLDRQMTPAETGERTGRTIEILGVLALALEAQGRPDEAEAALSRALSLARPEGYVRLFLDLGRSLYEVLRRLAARGAPAKAQGPALARVAGNYVRDLLEAFQQERETQGSRAAEGASPPPSLAEPRLDPLTERELDVLGLLAEGLSNIEIAGRLVVAPSTVKQHLKNIYGKLDVHSRTQAVARGRELGLL